MLVTLGYVTLIALLFAGRSVLSAVTLHLAADRALRARKLDLEERAVAVQENRVKPVAIPSSIPADLMRRVLRWGDPDAQEAERNVLLNLYASFPDAPDPWVEVRSHLPAEPRDDLPAEIFVGVMQS